VFRTSFTNSQPTLALGKPMMDKGLKRTVWITWKYAAGDEAFEGFRDSYTKAGGTIVKELGLPFPNVEFQALLTEIASLRPDAVACFFAGGGAAKFIRDYAAAGLKDKIPLWGSGFLTEGVLEAAGPAAEGIMTTMHYADSLDTPRNKQFRTAYATSFKMQPDVYAVQGYDTGLLLAQGLAAVKGDIGNKQALYKALETQVIDSPARQVEHEQGPQPDPGHLPAPRREQGQQGDRHRRQGAGGFGRGLQAGLSPAAPFERHVAPGPPGIDLGTS
jgi:branched-chain amino acid transport system substrate-binding protein